MKKAFVNGNIYTDSGMKEAMIIENGKFDFIGSNEEVKSKIDDSYEVIDLGGQYVLPGLMDAHCHAYGWAISNMMMADLTGGKNIEDYNSILKEYIEKHKEDADIRGRGWVNSYFENLCPTADILDALEDSKPVMMRSIDGHSVWVNSCLLKKAGITKDTPDPDGGKIEHYENGQPNGCLRDTAMTLVQKVLPDFSVEQYKKVIMATQEFYASLGYSSYYEAQINENYKVNLHKAYKELSDEGKLLLHTYGTYSIVYGDDALDHVDIAKKWHDETKDGMYKLADVKIFIDGVVEGGTVLLKEPYATDSNYYGTDRWPGVEKETQLAQIVEKANRLGLPCHFHAIGDRACWKAVNAIETAQTNNKDTSLRNAITHLQVVDPTDMDRMAKQNIVAVFNPWCYKAKNYFDEVETHYLGKERAENEYPVKSFIDKGVHCSFGTDFPMSPLCEPFKCMEKFVTRMDEGDISTLLKPSECISVQQTLDNFTKGTAYQFHMEKESGNIENGKIADFVVVNQNIFDIDPTTIHNTKALMTVVAGNVVYKK